MSVLPSVDTHTVVWEWQVRWPTGLVQDAVDEEHARRMAEQTHADRDPSWGGPDPHAAKLLSGEVFKRRVEVWPWKRS